MVRISAVFIAVCMVLIAGSVGAVLYIRFNFGGFAAAVGALGVLMALALYNAIAARARDRAEASEQVTTLARQASDMARLIAEFGGRLKTMEAKVDGVLERSLSATQPLATELEELSTLVKQLADSVAAHEKALGGTAKAPVAAAPLPVVIPVVPTAAEAAAASVPPAPPAPVAPSAAPALEATVPAFKGLDRAGIIAAVRSAIDSSRIDLYLQPIVTLPQRKVRYYEAVSRLRAESGEVVAAGDFLQFAEAGGLMPKLDNLSVLRCVQVVRRLLLKNRDIGLFCNMAAATLADAAFPQLLEFIEANRAIAPALVFEFAHSAVRAMGPIEHESLAALAERGFRFSLDNVADLRIEPRELTERGFRFIKVPAQLLLNRIGAASTDIHPADFSDLLGRFGIDLIAERIENETTVVDLLDYDVRFGQGFLFAPPRPVRAEALKGAGAAAGPTVNIDGEDKAAPSPAPARPATAGVAASAKPASEPRAALAQLVSTGIARR